MVEAAQDIRILLVDDDEDDAVLTGELFEEFERIESYRLDWVSTFDQGVEVLCEERHQACLLDYRLGAADGIELLQTVLNQGVRTPVIMLTGAGDRTVNQLAMRHGATDYLVKGELTAALLERAIFHAIERRRFSEDQRRLAAENGKLYRQAKRALEMRDEVHRVVAHDLRAPLSVIKLAAQMMERQLDSAPRSSELRGHLQTQNRCIAKMNRLIEDLLDAVRIDEGRLALQRSGCEPAELIEATLTEYAVAARDRSIELTGRFEQRLPAVQADARRIEQVLSNLVSNALKFTDEGGVVELSAHREAEVVRFLVRDTGCGIGPEKLDHLFDRFWQADGTSAEGVGLGLTICRGIVEAHGGRIDVDSTEGEGTTFSFTVPVAAAS